MQAGAEDIRRLQEKWFGSSSQFSDALNKAFDDIGFTESYVESCVQSAVSATASRKDKVIKDSVWGMVEIDSASARLLDCPIIQRLRSIRQLGFTFFTYPSAEHSRFIHSLGMYAVVRRFLESMERPGEQDRVAGYNIYPVPQKIRLDLLHASILHDAGHMPFSHASEFAFAAQPETFYCGPLTIDDFRFDVANFERESSTL